MTKITISNNLDDRMISRNKKGIINGLAGTIGNLAAGRYLMYQLGKKKSKQLRKADDELTKKLIDEVRSRNIGYTKGRYNNSFWGDKESIEEINEELKKNHLFRESLGLKKGEYLEVGENGGIFIGLDSPGILGHEMGHQKTQENKLTRWSQSKPAMYGRALGGLVGIATSAGTGYVLANRVNKNTYTGGVLDKALYYAPTAVSLAVNVPTLVSEASASINSLKDLKKHGASREQRVQALKELSSAYGTYAGAALADLGGNQALSSYVYNKVRK